MILTPRDAGNDNIGPRLMVVLLVTSIVAFFVVCIRCYYRIRDHHFGSDDICSGFSSVLFLILASVVSWGAVRGAYKPPNELTLKQTELGLRDDVVLQAVLASAEAFGKIAIALLQIRILSNTHFWKRLILWLIIFITVVFTIFTCCVSFFQCDDPKAAWDLALRPHTKCWSPWQVTLQATITSSWYTAVDFILAFFPIVIFWDLHISLKKKITILVLLGLGIITGVFSALKTALVIEENSADNEAQFRLQTFAAIELFLLIVLGCVPCMKKPWEMVISRMSSSTMVSSLRYLLTRRSSPSLVGKNSDDLRGTSGNDRDDSMEMGPVKHDIETP